MNRALEIVVLGKPQLKWQGRPLTADLISAKGQALLIYLAVTGQTCSRQAVAGLLWGDLPEERARGNLRFTLNKVRKVVGDYLLVSRQSLAFDFTRPHWLDAADFVAQAAAPDKADFFARLQEAVALYQGDFLDDFYLQDAPDFETWILVERERLQQMALSALFCLAEAAQKQGNFDQAIVFTRHILSLEPWREEAHRQLMLLLVRRGQRSAAMNQFETCRHTLVEAFGVEPAAETAALYEQIKQGEFEKVSDDDAATGPLTTRLETTPAAPRHNLPLQLTPFVGRETELTHIGGLLADPVCRLLTLAGPGGVGKTRLALTAAQAQLDRFRDGVCFVSLRGMTPAGAAEATELLIASIADALNYTFSAPRSPRDLLLNHLTDKAVLLLLDNFEPLLSPHLEARSEVTGLLLDILQHSSGVKLLVTSRERLNLSPECLVEVEGLPYPPTLARDAASTYPAIALFVQQARRIQPDFSLANQENAVNRICQLVAGFPLGIELAANWVRLLSCAEIAARLEEDLDILPVIPPAATGPHSSMRVVMDSSWAMLTEPEQQVFRRLSVFQEGFTLTAAEQIAEASLSVLNGLMNKSLVRRNKNGRYVLHELLSQYGANRLAASPVEARETRQKHSRFYASFLQARRGDLEDETDRSALAAIDAEIENIRAGWEWLLAQEEIEAIAPYLESLFLYYRRKAWFQEAAFALEQAFILEQTSDSQKGRWHRWLGEAHFNLGNLPESRRQLEQALALLDRPVPAHPGQRAVWMVGQTFLQGWQRIWPARRPLPNQEIQNRLEAVRACERLCLIYYFQSRSDHLTYTMLRGLNLAETVGMSPDLARAYATAAIGVSMIPWPALAEFYLRRALAAARDQGHPSALVWVLENAGLYWLRVGQWSKAQVLLEEGAEIARQIGDGRRWEECVGLLGAMLSVQGRFADSQALQRETIASARRRGDQQFQFHELSGMAENEFRLGNRAEALSFLAEAESLLAGNHGLVEEIRFYGLLAQARWQQGDWAGARQAAHMAEERINQGRSTAFYSLEGYAGPSEVYLALWENGANDLSPAEGKEVAKAARQAGKALQAFGRVLPVGQPRAWLHQGLYDWLAGRPQKAHRAWAKSLAVAKQLAMPYEEARAHYEIGRHLPASDPARQEHLTRAREIFTRLGAAYDSGRVQAALKQAEGK